TAAAAWPRPAARTGWPWRPGPQGSAGSSTAARSLDLQLPQLPDPAVVVLRLLQFGMGVARVDDPERAAVAHLQRGAVHDAGQKDVVAGRVLERDRRPVVVERNACNGGAGCADPL